MDTVNEKIFDSREYKRSRVMYIAQSTFEYFVTILVGDVFLAKLLSHMGISDAMIGIISSLVNIAFLFQLLTMVLNVKPKRHKFVSILGQMTSLVLYSSLFLLPFIPVSDSVRPYVVIGVMLTAQISIQLVSPYLFRWANSFVSPGRRGRYSAVREIISLVSGIVFTLSAGAVVDHFEGLGNIRGAFLFIAISIFIIGVLDFISLTYIKRDFEVKEEKGDKIPFKDIMKNTFGNLSFRNVIIMTALVSISRYFYVGFVATFKTTDLLYSVTAIQVINMVANAGRIFVSVPFGRYSDRTSFADGLKLGYIIESIGILALVFTTKSTRWGIVIYTIFYSVSFAGSNQNSYNITYSYVDQKYFVYALAIKTAVSGTLGFPTAILAGKILSHIQANGNVFMGISMYGQQFLAFISFVIMVVNILFIQFVIKKQKVKIQ